jgi:hypothetical protein
VAVVILAAIAIGLFAIIGLSRDAVSPWDPAAFTSPAACETGGSLFASPGGSPDGDGSRESPFDLATALSSKSPARPCDTIWLLPGTYAGQFASRVSGRPGRPVTVRQSPEGRATLDGAGASSAALTVFGAWTTFWGFEITNSDPRRISAEPGPWPTDIQRGAGAASQAQGVRFINLVVHDAAGGIGLDQWTGTEFSQAYGNIIYNNGWQGPDRPHGHGIYVQNRTPPRTIADNILFNQFSHGVHAYGSERAFLDNLILEGNVAFNNGSLSRTGLERDLLVGGGRRAHGLILRENMTWGRGQSAIMYEGCGEDAYLERNYLVGTTPLLLHNCAPRLFENTLVGDVSRLLPLPDGNTAHTDPPAGVVVRLRPNRYEPGRAHIVVYNWDARPFVPASLAGSGLLPGDRFEIRDAQNFYDAPLLTGTYQPGRPVELPMSKRPVALPVGTVANLPSHTAPDFGVFVLLRTSVRAGPDAR